MNLKSKQYWVDREKYYPFKDEVPHRSEQDIDPRDFNAISHGDFLRVPFDGVAHWGFKKIEDLNLFKKMGGRP